MLLDTCALLWLAQGGGRLSARALRAIASTPVLCVSAVSGFEVAVKHRHGKLALPVPPGEWFRTVLAHHDIAVLPLTLEVALRSVDLPPIHGDPCDRFIIATAQAHQLAVVTADQRFVRYGLEVLS